jgi:hypothetical protein
VLDIEHIESVHDAIEMELPTAAARQKLTAGQGVLGLDSACSGRAGGRPPRHPLPRRECLKFWLRQHDAFVVAGYYMSGLSQVSDRVGQCPLKSRGRLFITTIA